MDTKRRTKGFTLLELTLIIVIISVLSSFAVSQYVKAIEKSRGAEARSILGKLRSAQIAYYLETRQYTNSMSALPVSAPTACTPMFYYRYAVTSALATATRCTAGQNGKKPDGSVSYTIAVSYEPGTFECTPGWC